MDKTYRFRINPLTIATYIALAAAASAVTYYVAGTFGRVLCLALLTLAVLAAWAEGRSEG